MDFLRSVDVHVVRSEPFLEAVAGFFRAEGNDVEFEVDLVGFKETEFHHMPVGSKASFIHRAIALANENDQKRRDDVASQRKMEQQIVLAQHTQQLQDSQSLAAQLPF